MGTPLIITDQEREGIRLLCQFAAELPVDVTTLPARLLTPAGKREHMAAMTRQTIHIPLAFMVTFSIETGHPCGTCRHMSMSVERDGRIPNEFGLWMVAKEFGFWGGLDKCSVWPEQLKGHGLAINVVQPLNEHGPAKTS